MSDRAHDVAALDDALERRQAADIHRPVVFGFDHYLVYALPLFETGNADLVNSIGDVRRVSFHMTEEGIMKAKRLRSLAAGIIFDMASHGVALLAALDLLEMADSPAVTSHGRHRFTDPSLEGHVYFAETAAQFQLSIHAAPGEIAFNGSVGKAVASEDCRKELVIHGERGDLHVSLDNGDTAMWVEPEPAPGSVANEDGVPVVDLTTKRRRPRHPAGCSRHGVIVDALERGDEKSLFALLEVDECLTIVRILEQLRGCIAPQEYDVGDSFEVIARTVAS